MVTMSSTAPIAITCSLRRCSNLFSKASAVCWTGENWGNGRDSVGENQLGAKSNALPSRSETARLSTRLLKAVELGEGRHIKRGQPTGSEIKQHSIELRDDENAEGTLHAKGANCETPVIRERGVHFNLTHAITPLPARETFRGLSRTHSGERTPRRPGLKGLTSLSLPKACSPWRAAGVRCSGGSPKPT
jgi:hypothetical protein